MQFSSWCASWVQVLSDPRQKRFFKAKDMRDLFTLGDEYANATETSEIFASVNGEVTATLAAEQAPMSELNHAEGGSLPLHYWMLHITCLAPCAAALDIGVQNVPVVKASARNIEACIMTTAPANFLQGGCHRSAIGP